MCLYKKMRPDLNLEAVKVQSQQSLRSERFPISPQAAGPVFRRLPLRGKIELFGRICASSFHRFLFRIREISSYRPIDYQATLQCPPDEQEQPCSWIDARILGTDRLLARRRWADSEDARIFLEGFDAGEQWLRDTLHAQS